MRQPDNLPAFCRIHRNGRLLIMHECASSPLRVALRAVPDRARSARLIEMVTQASPPCRTADTCACASLRSSRKVARPTAAERLHVAGADGSSALQPAVREQMPRTCRSAIHRPGGRTNIEHFAECASGFFLLLLLLFHDSPIREISRACVFKSPLGHMGLKSRGTQAPGLGGCLRARPRHRARAPLDPRAGNAVTSTWRECRHDHLDTAPLNQLG